MPVKNQCEPEKCTCDASTVDVSGVPAGGEVVTLASGVSAAGGVTVGSDDMIKISFLVA